MKEFIEKLIGRLEEKFKYNSEQAEIYRKDSDKDAYFREKKDLYMDRANTYGEVMRIVNELAEEYINTSTDTSSGWISVKDSLPSDEKEYLVTLRDGEVTSAKYDKEEIVWVDPVEEYCEYPVIAWQNTPAPYTEGE